MGASDNVYRIPVWKIVATKIWASLVGIGVILGVVGGILTLWAAFRDPTPSAVLELLDRKCLTNMGETPGLQCEFSFAGKKVKNLWMIRVQLINSCSRNIIGVPNGDLMYSNMTFYVSSPYKIVSAELERCQFRAGLNWATNCISIAFNRWQPKQTCQIRFFCEGEAGNEVMPTLQQPEEVFKQGELVVSDCNEQMPKNTIISYLPYGWSISITIIGCIVFGVIFLGALWWLFIGMHWVNMICRLMWERKYYDQVMSLMIQEGSYDSQSSRLSVNSISAEFFNKHGIPMPVKSDFVKDKHINWAEIRIPLVIIGIMLLLSSVALISLIKV